MRITTYLGLYWGAHLWKVHFDRKKKLMCKAVLQGPHSLGAEGRTIKPVEPWTECSPLMMLMQRGIKKRIIDKTMETAI